MNISRKYIFIYVVELFAVLLLSTSAFTSAFFYISPNNSNKKLDCYFLEIKNNQVLCISKNLIMTYDISHIKNIEVIRKGTSRHFQNFTQETINIINELNSDKLATKKIREKEDNKKKILDSILVSVKSLFNNFKSQNGYNSLNTILLISGLIVFLIGSVGFLIATFRAGILWGLSCMFLPLISFIFLFVHWKTAAKPFLVSLLGIAILFLSTIFLPTAGTGRGFLKLNSGANHVTNTAFQCADKIYCSEMSPCAEAKFYLHNCPGTKMDGDGDGTPCERQWCH